MDIREAWKKQKELERMKTISQLLGFFTNGMLQTLVFYPELM